MKRYVSIISLLILIFTGLASCSSETDELTPTALQQEVFEPTEIKASVADFNNEYENTTRSAIVVDDIDGYQFVWAENDTIGIFPNQGFQVAFPMSNGAGSKSASFNGGGWGLKASSTYSAYSPMIGQFYLDKTKIPIKLTGQVQDSNNSTTHISPYDYMCAINSTVNESGIVNFDFNHLIFVLHLKLTLPQAGTYTSIVLETDGELTTEAALDLSSGNLKSKASTEIFTLKLNDIELTSDNLVLDAYMALLPVDLTDKTLKAKIFDSENNCYEVTLKSRNYEAGTFYHQARTATATSVSLPVVMINTPSWQGVTSKDNWIDNTTIVIRNVDGAIIEAPGKVKGRGNATWNYAKKPYAIKFSKKQSPFGFPENKNWVLLADYNDRSLLRTAYMCEASKAADIDFTINYKHVQLFLNGEYKGIYILTDKVEDSKNRINVEEDGYIIEDDNYYMNENVSFVSTLLQRGFSFKYPDDGDIVEGDENYNFICDFINNMEAALLKLEDDPNDEDYLNYIDIESFAKWYVATEAIDSRDPNRYYVLITKSAKLKMYPLWDPEWSMGLQPKAWGDVSDIETLSKRTYWYYQIYFKYLKLSPLFKAMMKEEWNKFYLKKVQITNNIETITTTISPAVGINFVLWPYDVSYNSLPLNVAFDTWEEEVDYLKQFFDKRMTYLNTFINSL